MDSRTQNELAHNRMAEHWLPEPELDPMALALRETTLTLALVFCSLPVCPNGLEQGTRPTVMNDQRFVLAEEPKSYSYLVGGHLYGAFTNSDSIFPAASLLRNLDSIKERAPEFFMSLGDIVRLPTENQLNAFRGSFLDALDFPVLNAVGNHEMVSRERYLAAFPGPITYTFRHGSVQHVVIDTELDVGRISGEQLEFLLQVLRDAQNQSSISSVAIYGHKLIWLADREELKTVRKNLNGPNGYQDDKGFTTTVLPTLRALAEKKQVAWFAGDIGSAHSLPFFYEKDEQLDLVWIATGIGDTEQDSILQVDVAESGRLSFHTVGLDGLGTKSLESYDLEYWREHFEKD